MPGGWCEKCGMCDKFFGGHEDCFDKCKWFYEDEKRNRLAAEKKKG
jgi:hypothetical protein